MNCKIISKSIDRNFFIIFYIMYKLSLQQYFRHPNSPKQNQIKREEEMGLFTFYKQQQQEQKYIRTQFGNKKKSSMKNPKRKYKFKYLKINSTGREEQKSKQFENYQMKETHNKNISPKMQTSQQKKDRKQIDVRKQKAKTKDNEDVDQNQNLTNFQKKGERKSFDASRNDIKKSPQQVFVSKSLKKIEDLLLFCDQRISVDKQKKQESSENTNKKIDKFIKKLKIEEETIQTINKGGLTVSGSRKVYRILLNVQDQEKSKQNTFQKSFLKKIRENYFSVDKKQFQQKVMRSSKTIDNLNNQNKKYFCNLINNFYLPHNQNNQAAKILRDTLRFPNLIIKNFNLKTEGNISPASKYQKNDFGSNTCKKTFQSSLKEKLKDNQSKTGLNDRLKILLKRQGVNNGFCKAERLKQKQVSLKV